MVSHNPRRRNVLRLVGGRGPDDPRDRLGEEETKEPTLGTSRRLWRKRDLPLSYVRTGIW